MPSDADRAFAWKEAAEAWDFAFKIHPMPEISTRAFADAEEKMKAARKLEAKVKKL